MQQDASNAKQLIVERVRQSTNILVAVSANPSVDALAAALGFALMLNKMDKHATAVFSGAMPPAMEFLNPGKTFEHSVDSLRDFIISLDKEKADRLRYKVEDDVVRIFITPYRTTITEKDLQFSQGDFNVDLILALGVEKREDLDKAIIAHGRILHDATVMTINAGNQQSSLGAIDWHEPSASSLCEMLVSVAEAFQVPNLLDQQIATALLTGIVAATDRFSNEHTTPRVMTMAAQLMAAGANQQLIANNLVKARELPQAPVANGQLLPDGPSIKVAPPVAEEEPKKDGELDITHPKKAEEPAATVIPVQSEPEQAPESNEAPRQAAAPAQPATEEPRSGRRRNRGRNRQQQSAEDELSAALPSAAAATSAFDDLKNAMEGEGKKDDVPAILKEPKAPGSQTVNGSSDDDEDAPKEDDGFVVGSSSWRGRRLEPPVLGGTLNATTEQAMDETIKSQEEDRNQKLLTHPDAPAKSKAPKVNPPTHEPEPAPMPKEEVTPAPAPEPAPTPIEAPQPAPVFEPEAQPAPEPVAPAPELTLPPVPDLPEPAPAPADLAPEPVLPPPPPAPVPEPLPEPAPVQPVVDATASEATPVAQPVAETGADLDAARRAVSDALASQPFNPAGQPLQSAGAMPLGITDEPAAPAAPADFAPPAPAPAPAPLPEPPTLTPAPEPMPEQSALPPLPPMPPLPQQDPTQPLPPPPSLNDLPPLPTNSLPPAPVAPPPEAPAPEAPQTPPDPKQFQIPGAS